MADSPLKNGSPPSSARVMRMAMFAMVATVTHAVYREMGIHSAPRRAVFRTFRYSAASTTHSARITMNDTPTASKCHSASHSTLSTQLAMNSAEVAVNAFGRVAAFRV